jgi:hypothetical protein
MRRGAFFMVKQMTDFNIELRHRCRNPKCRSKLPAPVANEREAFCSRGCHASFYRKRCLVCERAIEQPKRGSRLICDKAKCRNVWRVKIGFGRYAPSGAIQEMPDSIGVKQPIKPDLALFWKLLGNAVQTEFYGGGKWREVVSLDGVRCFVTRLWGKDPIAA